MTVKGSESEESEDDEEAADEEDACRRHSFAVRWRAEEDNDYDDDEVN